MSGKRREIPKNGENNRQKLLTGIHYAYTMCGTPESDLDEVDQLTVKHFLNTLVEVSLDIAFRKNGETDQ